MAVAVRGGRRRSTDPALDADYFARGSHASLVAPSECDRRLRSVEGLGAVIVQLVSCRDASCGSFSVVQADAQRSVLTLQVSDGTTTCAAVVSTAIDGLDLATPPGTKLRLDLRGSGVRLAWCVGADQIVAVLHGGNTEVLGGRVPKLVKEWVIARRDATVGRCTPVRADGVEGAPCFEAFTPEFLRATEERMEGELAAAFARQTARMTQRLVPKGATLDSAPPRGAAGSGAVVPHTNGGAQPPCDVDSDVQVASESSPCEPRRATQSLGGGAGAAAVAASDEGNDADAPETALSSSSTVFVPGPTRARATNLAALRIAALIDAEATKCAVWDVEVAVLSTRVTELHTAHTSPALRLVLRDRSGATAEVRAADSVLLFLASGEFLVCHHTPTYQCSLT